MSNIKILSLLFLVLCSHMPLVAQSDTAVMRISYDAKFKTCVERPEMQDEMELLIGNKWSKFILRQTYDSSMCLTAWCRHGWTTATGFGCKHTDERKWKAWAEIYGDEELSG